MKKEVLDFIHDRLRKHEPVTLVTVVESHGASPGRAGFAMAVGASGDHVGTIGGGVMELQWTEQAIAAAQSSQHGMTVVKKLFHSRDTQFEASGLICSGWQTVLLKRLDEDVLPVVESIRETFEQHDCGRLCITPAEFSFAAHERVPQDSTFAYTDDQHWRYEQTVGVLDTVYVVGSGHVGLALCRVLATLDFRVVVFDDRPNVETFVNNHFAHQKVTCHYGEVGGWVTGTEHEFVAVVTAGYVSDEAALRSLMNKNVKYIGLMGSPAKTMQIFNDLRAEGVAEDFLKRIHSPIGLPIASHTPAEIAVSIAAEIIQLKNHTPPC